MAFHCQVFLVYFITDAAVSTGQYVNVDEAAMYVYSICSKNIPTLPDMENRVIIGVSR